MLPEISQDVLNLLEKQRQVKAVSSNRASMLDDPCLRRLVYWRTCWQKAQPVSPELQGIFETGNTLEPLVGRILSEAGQMAQPAWRLIGEQTNIDDKLFSKYQITGHIDGLLQRWDDGLNTSPLARCWETLGPADIKTCSPHVFAGLNCYEDLKKYFWTRKWRGQLFLYALGLNYEDCFLILVNKQNLYQIKLIHFPLDYEYAERLLQNAAIINGHVAAGTLPEKINQPDVCEECPFNHHCCPDLVGTGEGLEISSDADLIALLDERVVAEPAHKRFMELDDELKGRLVPGKCVMAGDWTILWKQTATGQWRKKILNQAKKEIINVSM